MKTSSREIEHSAIHASSRRPGQSQSNVLSGLALLFSTVALALSGATFYQVVNGQPIADILNHVTQGKTPQATAPQPTTLSSATTNLPAASQPGTRVQSALEGKAEVTILGLERITDLEQGTRDVVNVKLRLRRLADNVSAFDFVNVGGAIARPSGGGGTITYEAIDTTKHSTGPISLEGIRKGASADAYVWLRIPENTHKIDLDIPETQPFQALEIAE